MAIVVAHNPSAAAIGNIAYDVGAESKKERLSNKAFEDTLKATSLKLESQKAAAQIAAVKSRISSERKQLALQEQQQNFNQEQELKRTDPAYQLQQGMIQQKLLEERTTYAYTEQQKRERQKIVEAVNMIRQDDSWKPEEKEIAEKRMWQKYYSITPMPQYDDTPKAGEVFEKSKIYEDGKYTGKYFDASGDIKIDPIFAQNSKENLAKLESAQKMAAEKIKYRLKLRATLNTEGVPAFSDEQIDKMMARDFAEFEPQKQPVVPKNKGVKTPKLSDIEAELRRRGVKL